uniref:Phosphatase and actin regulator n=1 Tax=Sphaeramia orbicularis TaxID=375764 RepID=A0A672YCB5_9TELE
MWKNTCLTKVLDFVHHPALKTPAAFHEQIRSLERARAGNFLKHKLCSRPERSELVRMHILQETQAEPSLQATQMKLKRARLADDLNEKIAQRPGPMELVEKNILPVDSGVKEVINGTYHIIHIIYIYRLKIYILLYFYILYLFILNMQRNKTK